MKQKRVLLIDDQSGFTRLLKLTLQRTGNCVVQEENDSSKALATALEFKPDIIFCDVEMPNVDGGEVASRIRSDRKLSHVPIVFLTTLVASQEAGHEIGGFPFLSKPVSVESILNSIREHTAEAA